MKTSVAMLLFLLLLQGCSQPLEIGQLEIKNDISYSKIEKKPYTGKVVSYFPGGNGEKRVHEEGFYRAGRKQGTWITWKWDGGRQEAEYEAGKLHGKTLTFDANDNKTGEYHYQNGRLHGYAYTWNPVNGEMTELSYYKEGVLAYLPSNPYNEKFPKILNQISGEFRDSTSAAQ
ncbi:MAG: hypothetical protein G8345_06570 [Magnetococcales bacterium]|nr:hypothetical protein [Magnetococcales bacterium]NGZ26535.1 hypothetical protein [Magnetococcales bacterium]